METERYRYIFTGEFLASSAIYGAIFWKLFNRFKHIGKSPKDCLSLSTNTISTIHSILMMSSFFDFFYNHRWTSHIIDEPLFTGHIWSVATGYYFTDSIGHLLCYMIFDKKLIPRRIDIIMHHLVAVPWLFICQWPSFMYAWGLFSPLPCIELTTIFLNLQWYGKHFKKKKLERISQIFFVVTWFPVRLGITAYYVWWLIVNWKEMSENEDFPVQTQIYLTFTGIILVPLQVIWSIFIAWKIVQETCMVSEETMAEEIVSSPPTNRTASPKSLHGVSMEFPKEHCYYLS